MICRAPLPASVHECLETLGSVVARCRGVVFAYLFGSVACGAITPLSDVDLAIYVDDREDLNEIRDRVLHAVTAHLGTDEVDLVVLNIAPTALQGRILQGRRVLCDLQPVRRHQYESRVMREFLDFRRFEHNILKRRFGSG